MNSARRYDAIVKMLSGTSDWAASGGGHLPLDQLSRRRASSASAES
jgi:hypothetical protein